MLFPSDFLTRLEYLSIISKRVFRGQLLAQRRTMQMGSGIEFSEHREYTAGDDLRYLDWNIYARHGDLLLKRFQEEQDLHVYLMLDCSRSMAFEIRPSLISRDIWSQLWLTSHWRIWTALPSSHTRMALLLSYRDPRKSEDPSHHEVSRRTSDIRRRHQPRKGSAGTPPPRRSNGACGGRGDLFDEHGFQRGLDQLRYRRFDAHVIQLHDPKEADPALLATPNWSTWRLREVERSLSQRRI